jgi:hypothetical protein
MLWRELSAIAWASREATAARMRARSWEGMVAERHPRSRAAVVDERHKDGGVARARVES